MELRSLRRLPDHLLPRLLRLYNLSIPHMPDQATHLAVPLSLPAKDQCRSCTMSGKTSWKRLRRMSSHSASQCLPLRRPNRLPNMLPYMHGLLPPPAILRIDNSTIHRRRHHLLRRQPLPLLPSVPYAIQPRKQYRGPHLRSVRVDICVHLTRLRLRLQALLPPRTDLQVPWQRFPRRPR